MPDREKVVNGLKHIQGLTSIQCLTFPKERIEFHKLINDALVLLKEQEAVEPEVEVLNEIDRLYRCPKCHKCFFYEKQKYCDQCGQAVKWE